MDLGAQIRPAVQRGWEDSSGSTVDNIVREVVRTLSPAPQAVTNAEAKQPRYYGLSDVALLEICGDSGQKWAEAFIEIVDIVGRDKIDEGLMIGWFANAIEHSNNVRRWQREQAAGPLYRPGRNG